MVILVSAATLLAGLAGFVIVAGPSHVIGLVLPGEKTAAATTDAGGSHESGSGASGEEGRGGALLNFAADPEIMLFDEIVVNLLPSERFTKRFLKIRVAITYIPSLSTPDPTLEKKVYLRDSFSDFLGQLSERDMRGTLGLSMVKAELLRRAKAIAGEDAILEILVTDMVMQ